MNIHEEVKHLGHYLPDQGPIQMFIHHNTLHGFEGKDFFQALKEASQFYGAQYLMPLSFYLNEVKKDRITEKELSWSLKLHGKNVTVINLINHAEKLSNLSMKENSAFSDVHLFRVRHYEHKTGLSFQSELQNLIVPFVSAYMDQGVSHWPMEFSQGSIWPAFRKWIQLQSFGLARKIKNISLHESSEEQLDLLISKSNLDSHEALKDWLFMLPGWAGMIHVFERKPLLIPYQKKTPIVIDFAAIVGTVSEAILADTPSQASRTKQSDAQNSTELDDIKKIFHLAYEKKYIDDVKKEFSKRLSKTTLEKPEYQMLFCIDDRSESMRRHIEGLSTNIETFGVAGFFGIDMCFQGLTSQDSLNYCPPVVNPKGLVREVAREDQVKNVTYKKWFKRVSKNFYNSTRTSVIGAFWSLGLGILSPLSLVLRVHFPRVSAYLSRTTNKLFIGEVKTKLEFSQLLGLPHEEIANRVYGLMMTAGLRTHFGKAIFVIAHGSTSQNNPHISAYDCGACGGKKGDPNSRAFVIATNDPTVREILAKKGIHIPANTRFIPGLHDTCSDEISFFDLSVEDQTLVNEVFPILKKARENNANERCFRFESAPETKDPKLSLSHVQSRSESYTEPRPELGHATNAVCFIGQRETTKGKFFDRRAFLISYDSGIDTETKFLSGLVNAILPVVSGINLEYFFSKMDNEKYGCGTKLPHNVMSLLGVSNGVFGDLRTGLPLQMIELHEPVRLLMALEATEKQIETLRINVPKFAEYIDLGWVLYARIDPTTKEMITQWN
ncbi:MAG: DUF2309 family protein [Xanthomonadaceae bacterium]|nr:DUF2309 family protein [Xanthomonadaceae bacterium]